MSNTTETRETVTLKDGTKLTAGNRDVIEVGRDGEEDRFVSDDWTVREMFATIAEQGRTIAALQQQQQQRDVLIVELRVALRSALDKIGRHERDCKALDGRSCDCGRDAAIALIKRASLPAAPVEPEQAGGAE